MGPDLLFGSHNLLRSVAITEIEMGEILRGQGGSVHALKEEPVSALHRRMTCSAPKHEGWDFDCGQRCCRQPETIGTRARTRGGQEAKVPAPP